MQIGRLRQRLVIQQATETTDSAGGHTPAWATLATVWATIAPLRGQEYLEAQAVESAVSVRITIRYRVDVTPRMRATWSGHIYEILDVVHDERRTMTEMMCKEIL